MVETWADDARILDDLSHLLSATNLEIPAIRSTGRPPPRVQNEESEEMYDLGSIEELSDAMEPDLPLIMRSLRDVEDFEFSRRAHRGLAQASAGPRSPGTSGRSRSPDRTSSEIAPSALNPNIPDFKPVSTQDGRQRPKINTSAVLQALGKKPVPQPVAMPKAQQPTVEELLQKARRNVGLTNLLKNLCAPNPGSKVPQLILPEPEPEKTVDDDEAPERKATINNTSPGKVDLWLSSNENGGSRKVREPTAEPVDLFNVKIGFKKYPIESPPSIVQEEETPIEVPPIPSAPPKKKMNYEEMYKKLKERKVNTQAVKAKVETYKGDWLDEKIEAALEKHKQEKLDGISHKKGKKSDNRKEDSPGTSGSNQDRPSTSGSSESSPSTSGSS